ncbi:hypothetical protein SCHPADRAFT_911106 [Schizopora paradoxa]|uniref:Ribosome maturation protein SDO1/SBDS N-terminal domain-containing protein n=1 Tax=Schizopora paradoxa TaxID=27342 RepID=A0A0H2R793_9AGAM|nr:hypothetical protein SCHPADRAFT_911106 [Schizopora paradoxa]
MSEFTRIVYDVKKGPKDTQTYSVIIDDVKAYEGWKENDTTGPMTFVADFDVFVAKGHGVSGDHASAQDLENTFSPLLKGEKEKAEEEDEEEDSKARTTKKKLKEDVIRFILLEGSEHRSQSNANDRNDRNVAGGGMRMDVRGSGAQMTGA